MKKLFVVLIVLLQFCSPSSSSDEPIDKIKEVETSLLSQPVYFEGDPTLTIKERMKHYHVPGVSIAVIDSFKIVWSKAYGVLDEETKEPVTTKSLFQAGSISKPVAAYGALKMVEEGKLSLDENVNAYLKRWQLPDNEFTQDKKVALKHLLSHTGGVTVHGFLGYSPDLPVPSLVQVLNGEKPANSPPIRVDKVPEESFRYSGGGYCIMQQMMIDVEEKDFPTIMKEKVLGPLNMINSTYDQPLKSEQLKLAATGYLPNGSMTKGKRHTYPEMAAAGLWTTAEDLALFVIDIQKTLRDESSAVLSKNMATKMLTPFIADFQGLGIGLNNRSGENYFGHGGWDEGFSSQMVAHKNRGYGVVVLTNSNHPDFINEVIRSVALTYEWDNYIPSPKKVPMETARFTSIVGRYKIGSDGMLKIYNEGDRLYGKFIRGGPFEIFQTSDTTYMCRENSRYIQFKKNPADEKMYLLLYEAGQKPKFINPLLAESEKIPHEYLLEKDFDNALKEYQAILKANPTDQDVQEGRLNQQGYNAMGNENYELAKNIFLINIKLYSNSSNVYDSYAEACMKNGDKELAITNYKKSLALDPNNQNAVKMLEDLQKK